jgi:hypothetical protein
MRPPHIPELPGPGWSTVVGGRSPEGKDADQALWDSMFCSLSIEDTHLSKIKNSRIGIGAFSFHISVHSTETSSQGMNWFAHSAIHTKYLLSVTSLHA